MSSEIDLAGLKKIKNNVIGNPSAKLALASDEQFIHNLVECLNQPPSLSKEPQGSLDDIRIEAAHVISSISYGSLTALQALLHADAPQALLYALSNFLPADSPALKSAYARALRAVSAAIAEAVGPGLWGLKSGRRDGEVKAEARGALEYLFQLDCLDIYLPLLSPTLPSTSTSTSTSASIAQMISTMARTSSHRALISEWLPPLERIKELSKGKRGWEQPGGPTSGGPMGLGTGRGGWVVQNLVRLIWSRDTKLQEASLSALAALAKDNPTVAGALVIISGKDGEAMYTSALSRALALSRTGSGSKEVQLAACLCATHILRASTGYTESCAASVMHSVMRLLSDPMEVAGVRTKACFILTFLVTDDATLAQLAVDRGALTKLADLVKFITPTEPSASGEWEDEEPESISCLREAALRTLAALCLFDNNHRRTLTDPNTLNLTSCLLLSLVHPYAGVRFAACQCVRVIGRAVSALRTNIVDSGLGMGVFAVFKREGEERDVCGAALAAVCNIVNEFSPLRSVYLEQGLVARLVQLLTTEDPDLRLSSLWAVKNLLNRTTLELKQEVMSQLGWGELSGLMSDLDGKVREQAFWVLRSLSENEFGVGLVFRELGSNGLLDSLTEGLNSRNEDIVLQAAYALANLANGTTKHQEFIISHPQILHSLRTCMSEAKVDVRRPVVSCVLHLIRGNPHRRREFHDAKISSTLRHMCDWSGGVGLSPGGRGHGTGHLVVEDDKVVIDLAREAVDWLDHGADVAV